MFFGRNEGKTRGERERERESGSNRSVKNAFSLSSHDKRRGAFVCACFFSRKRRLSEYYRTYIIIIVISTHYRADALRARTRAQYIEMNWPLTS